MASLATSLAGTKISSSREFNEIFSDLKEELAKRGARGIVGLQRKFRIMDDNGDKAISLSEFKKAMHESNLNFNDEVSELP